MNCSKGCKNGDCIGCRGGKIWCDDPRCYPNCPDCKLPDDERYFLYFVIIFVIFLFFLLILVIISYTNFTFYFFKNKKEEKLIK